MQADKINVGVGTDVEIEQIKQLITDLSTKTNNIENEIHELEVRHGITALRQKVDDLKREIGKLENKRDYLINQEYRLDPDKCVHASNTFPSNIKDINGNRLYKHHKVVVKVKVRDIEPYRYDGKRVDYVNMLPFICKSVKIVDELHNHKHNYHMTENGEFNNYRADENGIFWYYYSVSLFYKRTTQRCCKFSTINEIYKYEQIKFNEYID